MTYIASPFFNEEQREVYWKVIKYLRDLGCNLFVPAEHEIEDAWDLPNKKWAEAVFAVDLLGLQKCDKVIVLNWGMYSDTGTARECGYAYATGKTVINIVCCHGLEDYAFSLMMVNGCTQNILLTDFLRGDWQGLDLDLIEQK